LELRAGPASQTVKLPAFFFNRRPMTSDASIELTGERPAGNRQSHGSSCDRHVPVAHFLVLLRQPPIDRHRSASPLPKSPFFGGDEPV